MARRHSAPPEIRQTERGSVMVTCAKLQTIQVSISPISDPEALPMYRAHHLEIPASWRALCVVFYPAPDDCDGSGSLDTSDPLDQGWHRFQAGVLLCRQGTDGQAARQEFEAGVELEAAFLTPDGQYLQESPVRPVYGVLALEYSTPERRPDRLGECLVLMPLIRFPLLEGQSYPAPLLFVDGMEVV